MKTINKAIKAQDKNNKKIEVNKELDNFSNKNLFKEKLNKANHILSNLQFASK